MLAFSKKFFVCLFNTIFVTLALTLENDTLLEEEILGTYSAQVGHFGSVDQCSPEDQQSMIRNSQKVSCETRGPVGK